MLVKVSDLFKRREFPRKLAIGRKRNRNLSKKMYKTTSVGICGVYVQFFILVLLMINLNFFWNPYSRIASYVFVFSALSYYVF